MNTRETLNPILRAKDLPPGVLKQLGILDSHETEIVAVMRQHGGTLNIDETIVAFYDKDGRETDRNKLCATLARMCSMGVLSRVKAGEYSVREPGVSRMTCAAEPSEPDAMHNEFVAVPESMDATVVTVEAEPCSEEGAEQ